MARFRNHNRVKFQQEEMLVCASRRLVFAFASARAAPVAHFYQRRRSIARETFLLLRRGCLIVLLRSCAAVPR